MERCTFLHEKLCGGVACAKVRVWVRLMCKCVGEDHVEVGGCGSCGEMVVGVMICKMGSSV